MKKSKLITPGSKEWNSSIASVKAIGESVSSAPLKITFETVSISRQRYVLTFRHQAVMTEPGIYKFIMLFSPIAENDMLTVSGVIKTAVIQMNVSGTFAEAGISPLIKHQWDFVLFNIPEQALHTVRSSLIDRVCQALKT